VIAMSALARRFQLNLQQCRLVTFIGFVLLIIVKYWFGANTITIDLLIGYWIYLGLFVIPLEAEMIYARDAMYLIENIPWRSDDDLGDWQ